MSLIIDLLDDVMDWGDVGVLSSGRNHKVVEDHDCDGCGVLTANVDIWAKDRETGEELWLCGACVE